MKLTKGILLGSGILFIAIQVIRPVRNQNSQDLSTDISSVVIIPDTVLTLLKDACYDCHSNNTNYPWYSNIQPVGWLMAHHIKEAGSELNFSDFGSYSQRKQLSKLEGIGNSIEDDIMPPMYYKIMHRSAQLSTAEKLSLIKWVQQSMDSLSIDR
jgi:hypothetical protein